MEEKLDKLSEQVEALSNNLLKTFERLFTQISAEKAAPVLLTYISALIQKAGWTHAAISVDELKAAGQVKIYKDAEANSVIFAIEPKTKIAEVAIKENENKENA